MSIMCTIGEDEEPFTKRVLLAPTEHVSNGELLKEFLESLSAEIRWCLLCFLASIKKKGVYR